MGSGNNGFAFLPGVLIGATYFTFFWMKHEGQTLGNKLMAIKVIREDGHPLDIGTGIVRYIGYALSSIVFYLGFLCIIWDKKKQGWHDKMAKTVVVKTDAKPRTLLALLIIFVPLIIGTIVLVSIGGLAYLMYQKNPGSLKSSMSKIAPTQTPRELSTLSSDVFLGLNAFRTGYGIPKLTEDQRLCAYAQKRLEELNTAGKFDDGKGFYEDTANPTTNAAYFSGFGKLSSNSYTLDPLTTREDVSGVWTKNSDNSFTDKVYTHGCVRADGKFIVNIIAEKTTR